MKNLLILSLVLLSSFVSAQSKYYTKTGSTFFKASVETFEPVEAINKSTTALLNTENNQFAALIFVKAFHFDIALMQEHFNENYMDSDTHPKATFKGVIEDFKFDSISEIKKEYPIKGTLNIHGVAKDVSILSSIYKENEALIMEADFTVSPKDFNIEIPSIVKNKISETITISFTYELIQKK